MLTLRMVKAMDTDTLRERTNEQGHFVNFCRSAGFVIGSSVAAEEAELALLEDELELRWASGENR